MKNLREIGESLWRLPSSNVANALVMLGLIVSVLGLIANSILVVYSHRQWVAVNQTLKEMQKQTPAVIQSGRAAQESAETAKNEAESSDKSTQEVLAQMKRQSDAANTLANATRSLAQTSTQQLDWAERPVLMLSDTKLPGAGVNKDAYVSYDLDLKVDNNGRNPATNTAVLTNLIFPKRGESWFQPQRAIDQTCHEADKVGPLAGILIASGAKNDEIHINLGHQIGSFRDALSDARVDPQTGNRTVLGYLTVCLLYRSPLSQQVHHTGLVYDTGLTFSDYEVKEILSGSMRPVDVIWLRPDRIVLRKWDVMNGIAD